MMLVLTSQKMEGVSKLAVETRLQCFPKGTERAGLARKSARARGRAGLWGLPVPARALRAASCELPCPPAPRGRALCALRAARKNGRRFVSSAKNTDRGPDLTPGCQVSTPKDAKHHFGIDQVMF